METGKPEKKVLVIGGGTAGLAAALALARAGVRVDLVERSATLGGHAALLACKAVEKCVKCGACTVTEAATAVRSHPGVRLHMESRLEKSANRGPAGFEFSLTRPHDGALAYSARADAVLLATGFQLFDPTDKPYGYGLYPEVITNLDLEARLRRPDGLKRSAAGAVLKRLAFIHCVGSRDARLGHPWCSAYCCGAALRAAALVKSRLPEVEIALFYIDIQTFGRDFEEGVAAARRRFRFIRALPAEAYPAEGGGVRVAYVSDENGLPVEESFELLVLAAGMVPSPETARTAALLGLSPAPQGFFGAATRSALPEGVFPAGSAGTPMTIAAAAADGRRAAAEALAWIDRAPRSTACRAAAAALDARG